VSPSDVLLLSLLILAAAALYSSVGHGGASGYLAAMALFGLAPGVMRPTALCLNLLVASLGTFRFWRAGHFRWRTFWPFAATSVPAAYLGGALTLPSAVYKQLVGLVLLFAAYRLFRHTLGGPKSERRETAGGAKSRVTPDAARDVVSETRHDASIVETNDTGGVKTRGTNGEKARAVSDEGTRATRSEETRRAPTWAAMLLGAVIGLLSGLTGVGGGIFLSPVLLLARWADARRTAAVSAAFILVNSAAGLLGNPAGVKSVSSSLPYLAAAALAGGLLGTELGTRRLPPRSIRQLLAAVLLVAALKLILV
jgi:uncharacterized protein